MEEECVGWAVVETCEGGAMEEDSWAVAEEYVGWAAQGKGGVAEEVETCGGWVVEEEEWEGWMVEEDSWVAEEVRGCEDRSAAFTASGQKVCQ